jgi:hypothetical protein
MYHAVQLPGRAGNRDSFTTVEKKFSSYPYSQERLSDLRPYKIGTITRALSQGHSGWDLKLTIHYYLVLTLKILATVFFMTSCLIHYSLSAATILP